MSFDIKKNLFVKGVFILIFNKSLTKVLQNVNINGGGGSKRKDKKSKRQAEIPGTQYMNIITKKYDFYKN